MKTWRAWSKKKKVSISIVIVLLVVGSFGSYKHYQNKQHKKQVTQETKILNKELDLVKELSMNVESYRDSDNPNFLSSDVTIADLESIEAQLEKIQSDHKIASLVEVEELGYEVMTSISTVSNEVSIMRFQAESQQQINGLFFSDKEVAINGMDVNNDLPIIDDLKLEQLESAVANSKNRDMLTLVPASVNENASWEQTVNTLTDNATAQFNKIEKANTLINTFFKDKKPIDTINSSKIKEAEKEISGIKNAKAKKELTDKLKQVSDVVAKKETEDVIKELESQGAIVLENGNSADCEYIEKNQNNQSQTNDYSYSENTIPYSNSTSSYVAPNNNSNGSTNTGGSSTNNNNNQPSSNNGDTWSGTGNQTGGGDVNYSGNGTEGGGSSWTGGDFDGSDIPDW